MTVNHDVVGSSPTAGVNKAYEKKKKSNHLGFFFFIMMMNQAFCFCHVCYNLYERVELATHNQPYFPSSLNTK